MIKILLALLISAIHFYGLPLIFEIKKPIICVFPISIKLISALDSSVEKSERLGFGFKVITKAEELPKSPEFFESIGQFKYLYFNEINLGQFSQYSISPSGQFALYQDGPTGKLFLFNARSRTSKLVVEIFIGLAENFEWQEMKGKAYIKFNGGTQRVKINLK